VAKELEARMKQYLTDNPAPPWSQPKALSEG
jgi:hypothetical protein